MFLVSNVLRTLYITIEIIQPPPVPKRADSKKGKIRVADKLI